MSTNSVAVNTAFVDIATWTSLEANIYGGPGAVNWFLASFQKSNWFSFIPVSVRHTGTFDFGQTNASATFNRAGDYILNVWFRAILPQIMLPAAPATPPPGYVPLNPGARLRYTNYPMHNLFESISVTFNDLRVQSFSSHWLDVNFQFNTNAGKRLGYRNMVGDIDAFTGPKAPGVPVGHGGYLNLPLPLFFTEDSGVALPATALPYNEVKVVYQIRPFNQLIVIEPGTIMTLPGPVTTRNPTVSDVVLVGAATTIIVDDEPVTVYAPGSGPIALRDAQTFIHFAVVHDDERAKIGVCPRDILIHQIQEAQQAPFRNLDVRASFDIRFSYSIVALFFMVRNDTIFGVNSGAFGRDWSNYTTSINKLLGFDPIEHATLYYESTPRFSMGADYFSLVAPWYWSKHSIPEDTGYHMYSYALHPFELLTPSGSTNYSKLANVSIAYDMSPVAQLAAGAITVPPNPPGTPIDIDGSTVLTYGGLNAPYRGTHILLALSLNLVRISGGSLGFPAL